MHSRTRPSSGVEIVPATTSATEVVSAPESTNQIVPAVDSELTPSAATRVADGWSASTRTGYARDWSGFSSWCTTAGRTALPATAEPPTSAAARLAAAGAAPRALDRALGALAPRHPADGHTLAPKAPRRALRRCARQWAAEGGRRRRAPALTVEQLRSMLE